jgi:O-antigen ligase
MICLATGILGGPLAYGATGPTSGLLLHCLIGGAIIAAVLATKKLSRTWWCPLVAAAFGIAQVTGLPFSVCETIAPLPAELWRAAGGYHGQPLAAISVDPYATTRAVTNLVLMLGVGSATKDLLIRTGATRIVSVAIAIAGVVTWSLGLCFPVTRTKGSPLLAYADLIGPIDWWLTPLKRPEQASGFGYLYWTEAAGRKFAAFEWAIGDGFGTYVVSNHFACAAYLTIPTLFSLLLAVRLKLGLAWVRSAVICGLAVGLVGTIAILAGSRAGAMSATLAMLTFWAIVETRPWLKPVAVIVCCGYAAIVAAFVVFFYGDLGVVVNWAPEAVQTAMRAMFEDVRITNTATAFKIFSESWPMGTGLGTFGELYRIAVPERAAVQWFTHNDYAQVLAETGIVGAAALLCVMGVLLRQFASFLRFADPEQRLTYAGPWAGLAGVAAHSAFDWNMHVPANAFLTAVLAGIVLSPRFDATATDETLAGPNSAKTVLGAKTLIVLGVVLCLGLSIRDTFSDLAVRGMRDALTSVRKAKREKTQPEYGPLTAAVAKAERVAEFDPSNPEIAQVIGQSMLVLAGNPQPIDAANGLVAEADAWFNRVRRNKATSHGLPVMIVNESKLPNP